MFMAMATDFSDAFADSDFLWGARQIGEYLNLSERQVRYAHEKGELPIGRARNKLVASKSNLDAFLNGLTSIRAGQIEGGAA